MSQNARLSLRLLAATVMAVIATAVLSVGTVLAGGGGPPFPH
jgi:hypothetical protein